VHLWHPWEDSNLWPTA